MENSGRRFLSLLNGYIWCLDFKSKGFPFSFAKQFSFVAARLPRVSLLRRSLWPKAAGSYDTFVVGGVFFPFPTRSRRRRWISPRALRITSKNPSRARWESRSPLRVSNLNYSPQKTPDTAFKIRSLSWRSASRNRTSEWSSAGFVSYVPLFLCLTREASLLDRKRLAFVFFLSFD